MHKLTTCIKQSSTMTRFTLTLSLVFILIFQTAAQDSASLRIQRFARLNIKLRLTISPATNLASELRQRQIINTARFQQIQDSIKILSKIIETSDIPTPQQVQSLSLKYHFIKETLFGIIDSLHLNTVKKPTKFKNAVLNYMNQNNLFQVYSDEYDDLNWTRQDLLFGKYVKKKAELF